MRTEIITFANHKGGTGKTTSALAVAEGLHRKGLSVLVVDLDPQCNATESLVGGYPKITVLDSFLSPKTDCSVKVKPGLYLLPASLEMTDLADRIVMKVSKETILRKILRNMDAEDRFDVVIIDCAPSLDSVTVNALAVCTKLYVPLQPEFHSLKGLAKLEKKCQELTDDEDFVNPNLEISGIIITMMTDRIKTNHQIESELRQRFGDKVFKTVIHRGSKISDAACNGENIFDFAPSSRPVIEYSLLVEEIYKSLFA